MINTNGEVKQATAEPKKLGIRTTQAVIETPVEPTTRGAGPGKMITTHDEPEVIHGRMAKIRARHEAEAQKDALIAEPASESKKGKGKKAE